MSAKPDLWMPFYISDYIADTQHLSTEEHGAYVLLLIHAWINSGALPRDPERLRLVSKMNRRSWKSSWPTLQLFFFERDGSLRNKRTDVELARARSIMAQRSDAGKASAEKRWGKRGGNEDCNENGNGPITKRVTKRPRKNAPLPLPLQTTEVLPSPPQSPSQSQTSTPVTPGASPADVSNGLNGEAKTAKAWTAYSTAYRERYGVEPVRNAMVNAKLSQLVDRIGATEAPEVAAFYLSHNSQFYVKSRHPVGLLLQDSEGLRTQWATGVKATGLEGRSAEQKDAVREQVKRVSERIHGTDETR